MLKQWFQVSGLVFVLSMAGTLLTAGSGSAQLYNTVAIETPSSFIFYTFPANYYPNFIPFYPYYGYPALGLFPGGYPDGRYSTTMDLMPAPQQKTGSATIHPVAGRAAAAEATTATLDVRTPAPAKVWIQGKQMSAKDGGQHFVLQALEPSRLYRYDVRVTWTDGDRQITRTQPLTVRAGDRKSVLFLEPGSATAQRQAKVKVAER